MIHALVADDHAMVRRGVRQTLESERDIRVSGEAASGDEVLALVARQRWDVLVLDITMPGGNGFEVLAQVKRLRPELPVLILSMHPEDQFAARAFRAGASGYLTKESAPSELVAAVRQVVAGRRFVTPAFAEKLAANLQTPTSGPPHEALSDREFEVLRLLGGGLRGKEIAARLNLSPKTVSTYKTRVLQKLGVRNTASLVVYAIEHNLLDVRVVRP